MACTPGPIEMHLVVAQTLSRPKRVNRPAEACNSLRQFCAGDLQMALLADIHLPLGRQLRRVHNSRANRLGLNTPARCQLYVAAARAMASLAVDAQRKLLRKPGFAPVAIGPGGQRGIGVVAEHAVVVDRAAEIGVPRLVVTRTHSPAALLGIPGDGKLGQLAGRGKVQIAAGVITGSNDIADLDLQNVSRPAAVVHLIAELIKAALTFRHAIVAVGSSVMEMIVLPVVFDDVAGGWAIERAGHGHALIAFGKGRVARAATVGGRVDGFGQR